MEVTLCVTVNSPVASRAYAQAPLSTHLIASQMAEIYPYRLTTYRTTIHPKFHRFLCQPARPDRNGSERGGDSRGMLGPAFPLMLACFARLLMIC
jgi:hypothetical protein